MARQTQSPRALYNYTNKYSRTSKSVNNGTRLEYLRIIGLMLLSYPGRIPFLPGYGRCYQDVEISLLLSYSKLFGVLRGKIRPGRTAVFPDTV